MGKNSGTKKTSPNDWHRAQILCALKMAGWSISSLSLHHSYASRHTLSHALHRPWPKGERLIAEAIGKRPDEIWPSRYPSDSTARSNGRSRRRVTAGDRAAA
ncbi:helix-turn-helix domain-containing protein [Denitromonas halophila]|uniref:Transcriptional regulator n=1 Tax=Denitromonas halophila TaxID=1629404 RepID=A0A557QXF7_9RHOO|nr:transcriptional regulator [Denitromonas halophila]